MPSAFRDGKTPVVSHEQLKSKIKAITLEEDYKYLSATQILWWEKKRVLDSINRYLEHHYYLSRIPEEQLPKGLENLLGQRNSRIARLAHDYMSMPQSPANSLCYNVASYLETLTGTNRFQILIPSIENFNNDRDNSAPRHGKMRLHEFVLSDDRKRTINVFSCLKHARLTNQLEHTAKNPSGEFDKLSPTETQRVIYHSRYTASYYTACQAYQLAVSKQSKACYWLSLLGNELASKLTLEEFVKRIHKFWKWFACINKNIQSALLEKGLGKIIPGINEDLGSYYWLNWPDRAISAIERFIKDQAILSEAYEMTDEEQKASLNWFAQACDKAEEILRKGLASADYVVDRLPSAGAKEAEEQIARNIIQEFCPNEVINFSLMLDAHAFTYYLPFLAEQVLSQIKQSYDFFEYYREYRQKLNFLPRLIEQMTSDIKTMPQFLVSIFCEVNCPSLDRIEEFCHSLDDLKLLVSCPVLSGNWKHKHLLNAAATPLFAKYLHTIEEWQQFISENQFTYLLYPVIDTLLSPQVQDISALSKVLTLLTKDNAKSYLQKFDINCLQKTPFNLSDLVDVLRFSDIELQKKLLLTFRVEIQTANANSYSLQQLYSVTHREHDSFLLSIIDKQIQRHYLDLCYSLPFTFSGLASGSL